MLWSSLVRSRVKAGLISSRFGLSRLRKWICRSTVMIGLFGDALSVRRRSPLSSRRAIASLISQSDRLRHPIKNPSKDPRSSLWVAGFSATNAIALDLYQSTLAKSSFLQCTSVPLQPINPDPRLLTLLVIGTADNVRAHILRQHALGVAEADSWSELIPVPSCPDKFMCILNRIMV